MLEYEKDVDADAIVRNAERSSDKPRQLQGRSAVLNSSGVAAHLRRHEIWSTRSRPALTDCFWADSGHSM